jgi:hypothetical protein
MTNPEPYAPYAYPAEWWDQTEQLSAVRDYAAANGVAPEGVYVSTLTAVSSHIPPGVLTATGDEPSLLTGIVGYPGSGKTETRRVAGEILAPLNRIIAGSPKGLIRHLHHLQERNQLASVCVEFTGGASVEEFIRGTRRGRGQAIFRELINGGTVRAVGARNTTVLEGGSYRVTVCEELYPGRSDPIDRYVFALGLVAPASDADPVLPRVRLPETWIPGPQPMPAAAAADPDANPMRFTLMTGHAALHGRAVPTDADWVATAEPARASAWIRDLLAAAAPGRRRA